MSHEELTASKVVSTVFQLTKQPRTEQILTQFPGQLSQIGAAIEQYQSQLPIDALPLEELRVIGANAQRAREQEQTAHFLSQLFVRALADASQTGDQAAVRDILNWYKSVNLPPEEVEETPRATPTNNQSEEQVVEEEAPEALRASRATERQASPTTDAREGRNRRSNDRSGTTTPTIERSPAEIEAELFDIQSLDDIEHIFEEFGSIELLERARYLLELGELNPSVRFAQEGEVRRQFQKVPRKNIYMALIYSFITAEYDAGERIYGVVSVRKTAQRMHDIMLDLLPSSHTKDYVRFFRETLPDLHDNEIATDYLNKVLTSNSTPQEDDSRQTRNGTSRSERSRPSRNGSQESNRPRRTERRSNRQAGGATDTAADRGTTPIRMARSVEPGHTLESTESSQPESQNEVDIDAHPLVIGEIVSILLTIGIEAGDAIFLENSLSFVWALALAHTPLAGFFLYWLTTLSNSQNQNR